MYIVEGNIGAGKSTFLTMVTKHLLTVSVALEPLQTWHREQYGQSLLHLFYAQPQRWAYTLETLALMARIKEHLSEQNNPDPRCLVERSIFSGHYCFAKNSYQSGFLTDLEWGMYQEWFAFLTAGKCVLPHGFIYLKIEPENALERIQKRNRSAEAGMPITYLQDIDRLHRDLLIERTTPCKELNTVPVLVLDCNDDFEHSPERFSSHCRAVEQFMHETQQEKPSCIQAIAPTLKLFPKHFRSC